MSRDWLLYLDDLTEAAEKIGRFVTDRTLDEFTADETRFDAVLFNLQVIGEAVKHLPETARAAMPEIDWSGAARLRDIILRRLRHHRRRRARNGPALDHGGIGGTLPYPYHPPAEKGH